MLVSHWEWLEKMGIIRDVRNWVSDAQQGHVSFSGDKESNFLDGASNFTNRILNNRALLRIL